MDLQTLRSYVDSGMSQRRIANELDISQSTVKYWLKKYRLKTRGSLTSEKTKNRCNVCGKEYNAGHGNYKNFCQTCRVNHRRRLLKIRAIQYLGGKCIHCGYSKCINSLQFHHRKTNEKDFEISSGKYSWESIVTELDKCDLVCANCHGEIHYALQAETVQAPA